MHIYRQKKDDKIVIFGAGSGGRKVAKLLLDLKYSIYAFVDSDCNKWEQEVFGINVKDPLFLKEKNLSIIVASIYEEEIIRYLEQNDLIKNRRFKEEYIMKYAFAHMGEIKALKKNRSNNQERKNLILSSEVGLGNWGIEKYTKTQADIFIKAGIPVFLITAKGLADVADLLKDFVYEVDYVNHSYWESIIESAVFIIDHLPCIVQDNWQHTTLIAAILVKNLYPNDVTIVSVVHNDLIKLINIVDFFSGQIDYISAVSKDIIAKLSKRISKNKLVYKESPVKSADISERYYEENIENKIRIAYGARITKKQKRTHLLLEIAEYLERKNVKYQMDIVGAGEYAIELQNEIVEKNLDNNVKYLGELQNSEMHNFWLEHDIFVNVSEFEGVGLSMLEAMAAGCVPIVTAVAGAYEYIEDGYNGYVCNIKDMKKMADRIVILEKNRNLLRKIGNAANETIKNKCNIDDYKDFWGNILFN